MEQFTCTVVISCYAVGLQYRTLAVIPRKVERQAIRYLSDFQFDLYVTWLRRYLPEQSVR